MSLEERTGFSGLYTNVAETKAPPGLLRVANNVVLRKPGAIEPRQGFPRRADALPSLPYTWLNSVVYDGKLLLEDAAGIHPPPEAGLPVLGDGTLDWVNPNVTLGSPKARFRRDSFASAQLRGNLYLPMAQGVMRYPTGSDTRLRLAGEPAARCGFNGAAGTTTGTGLPNGFSWTYRLAIRRTDPAGLITRSRPTGAMTVRNTSGGERSARLFMTVNYGGGTGGLQADETLELYRGRAFANGIQPDDEMALVKEFTRVDSLVSNGFQSFAVTDSVPDSKRGAALYTSPSQLGFEAASDPPPAAAFCDTYRGCLFLGNIRGPARKIFSYAFVALTDVVNGATGSDLPSGERLVNLTTTAGSSTATLASAVGIRVGQIFISGQLPYYGVVQTLVGTTITFTALDGGAMTALATSTAEATFSDALKINSNSPFSQLPSSVPFGAGTGLSVFTGGPSGIGAYLLTPPSPTFNATVVIERLDRSVDTSRITASHGSEMSPPIALPGSAGTPFDQDIYPNGIVWSAADQPENFPVVNYALVGDKTKHILGVCATRDALFIFKEDGIWRLSGFNGQWSIDPFDMTTFCVLPSSIKRLNNRIFMLSNKGVVAISDAEGVVVLSTPIADQVKRLVDDARANFKAQGYYSLSGVPGVAACIDDRNSEYLLLTGTTPLELGAPARAALVYNELSGSWTTFSFDSTGALGASFLPTALGVSESGSPMILHSAGVREASYAAQLVDGEVSVALHDGQANLSVLSAVQGPVSAQLSLGVAFAAVPGIDFVLAGSALFPVLSAPTAFQLVVDTSSAPWPGTAGAVPIVRAVRADVQPHGWVNAAPAVKRHKETALLFSRLLGPVSMGVYYSGAEQLAAEPAQQLLQPVALALAGGMARYHLGTHLRALVHVNHERAWLLRARLSWLNAFGTVSLESIALNSEQLAVARPQLNASST